MSPAPFWRTVLATVAAAMVLAIIGGAVIVLSGVFNVAAVDRHWPLTQWLLETARTNSIKARATGIQVPAGLDDEARRVMGVAHFADHCAVCHGAPGVPKGDIAQGLYPQPPDLERVSTHFSDAELFWIVRNGIKMTGMPAWADHSDEEIWATVAFMKKLPGMTPEQYGKLVMAAMAHGGHQPLGGGTKEQGHPSDHPGAAHQHDRDPAPPMPKDGK